MPNLLFVLFLSTAGSSVFLPCQDAEITDPAARSTVTEARPVLGWRAIPRTSRYRVEIESRVPEGRAVVSLDTHVSSTLFRPPQLLTNFRAAVKVRVTAGCPADDGGQLRGKAASFYIDTSPLCPAPAEIALSNDQRNVEWSPTDKAIRYVVTLLRPDGTVVRQGQTQRRAFPFPLPRDGEALVATVRPYCATGFGLWGSALIAPARP